MDGRDLDVRNESNLVEQDRTSSIMFHVEAIRQEFVLEVLNFFLQRDDVPFLRNMLFDGSFFSASMSRVPIVDAEPSVLSGG